VLVVLAQVALVTYATRLAGRVDTASAALVLLLPGIAASIAFGVFCVIPERRRRRHRPRKRRARSSASSVPRPSSNGHTKRKRNGHGNANDS